MKLLAFDLSTRRGTIALVNEEGILSATDWPNDRRTSAPFFATLKEIIREHGAPETIVVGLGPGSYTGTRIAISAAIGLQATTGAALAGISSLCAISDEKEFYVIGDAKRASFFFAKISGGLLANDPDLLSENEMNDRLSSITTIPIYTSDELPQFTAVRAAVSFGEIALSAGANLSAESCSRPARADLPSRTTYHNAAKCTKMMEKHYRCWAEIDRSALRHNVAFVREKFGPDIDLLAVVKANAYGHGMIEVAQTIADQANIFGVANLEEATALRGGGPAIQSRFSGQPCRRSEPRSRSADSFHRSQLWKKRGISIASHAGKRSRSISKSIPAWDGWACWKREAVAVFKEVSALPNIKVHSVSTHLPVSNEDEQFTREELHNFGKLIKQLRVEVPGDYKAHALQTAGVLAFAEEPFEIVRPGMLIYGISSLPEFQSALTSGDDLENADRAHSRDAGRTRNQLWAHLHHPQENARRHAFLWLCRWLSAPSFQSGNFSAGPRSTLRAARPRNNGFDDDRRFASGRRGGGR